ncbi:MAG TPA: IS110 family transposase [Candidatus Luteococcus avicola]|nr:IS110 family transposase [Candidatus Luteococcus avicola]
MSVQPPARPLDDTLGLALVAGIDTHKDTHHVAIVDQVGRLIADHQFATTVEGYGQIVQFLHRHGNVSAVGVEGTGSYGAGVSRVLNAAGFRVLEVIRPNRQQRRAKGKSDPLDAEQAARTVLSGQGATTPKSASGAVECLRMLLTERRSANKSRTQTINQLHAVLVTAPDLVRNTYRDLITEQIITKAARSRPTAFDMADVTTTARIVLRRLATRAQQLQDEVRTIDAEMTALIAQINPAMLQINGMGPLTAATLLTAAGDNPERLASRAGFAALVGVAPVPASSGQRVRHRLSRGGNRHANSAIHRIILLRLRHHEARTTAYVTRRQAEGLSDRDIMRCLKRHVANEIFKAITAPQPADTTGQQLRHQREGTGLTISELARRLDVPYQRLRRLETGERVDPDLAARARAHLEHLALLAA